MMIVTGCILIEQAVYLISAFGLDHILDILVQHFLVSIGPSLYLEVGEAHRHVLVVKSVAGNVCLLIHALFKGGVIGALKGLHSLGNYLRTHVHKVDKWRYLVVDYLLLTQILIMIFSHRAVRNADSIQQELAFFLVRKSLQEIELIVPVIIKNDEAVVSFELLFKLFRVLYLLAGRGCICEFRISLAEILFKERRKDDYLIDIVFRHFAYLVAELIFKMLGLQKRICKGKTHSYAEVVICMNYPVCGIQVGKSADSASSVPEGRRESTVNGSYLNAVSEKLGSFLNKLDVVIIQMKMCSDTGYVKKCIHYLILPA